MQPLQDAQVIALKEIDIKPKLHTLLQASSRLYMHFARQTLGILGSAGERTVRSHLRKYGQFRAHEMREAHNALGRPIDMETLNRCWDSASVFVVKDDIDKEGSYSPNDTWYDVRYCPASEAWKADDFHRWGHVYCDEFHQACASSYHPDGHVVIPINMMKGDDRCTFRWVMPPTAEKIENWPATELGLKLAQYYQADTPERAAYDAIFRTNRLLGGRYWTMVDALYSNHSPEEAETVIRAFLRSWGQQRGELLRETHRKDQIELSPEHLIRDMDLLPEVAWQMDTRLGVDGEIELSIDFTPTDDAWMDLNCGESARLFWEVSTPSMVNAYSENLSVELTELVWRGDARTTLKFRATR